MKKINYLLLVVAAVAALSCAKNQIEKTEVEEISGPTVTVTCDFAQPDTKVAINDANGKTTWEEGDVLSIHGKYFDKSVTVTLEKENIVNAGKTATFTVTLPTTPYGLGANDSEKQANPDGYYAVYPASAAIADDGDNHGYWYCAFGNTNLPLMASYYNSSEAKFTFFNLCGIMSFVVSGGDAYDSYELEGMDGEVVGYEHYTVKIVPDSQTYNYTSHTTTPLTTVSGTVVADGSTPNLICFPNGVTFSDGFKLVLKKGGSAVKQLTYPSAITIARNTYRPIGDITSYLTAPVAAPATNHYNTSAITVGTATALDGSATANCYVVSAAGNYKFRAVKGNNTSEELTTIASVGILWETQNTTDATSVNDIISAVDYEYQDGGTPYMVFSTPGTLKHGNAVIYAKDDHDDIIWSWHIWIPEVAVSNADYSTFIGGNMMNMNLGALEEVPASGAATIKSLGLLYQWGRKDPFVGAASWAKSPTRATIAGTSWTKSEGKAPMAAAIKHPSVLYIAVPSNDDADWNSITTSNLWDNSGSKTIYDPCPAGYKVPSAASGSIWTQSDTNWSLDLENHIWEYTSTSPSFKVRIPLAGYVECWGGNLYGTGPDEKSVNCAHAYLWSATTYDSGERGRCMYIRTSKSAGSRYYGAKRGKANAATVRCIAE